MLLYSGRSLRPLEVPVGKPLRGGESVAENHHQHPQRVLPRQPGRQRVHARELPLRDCREDAGLWRSELGAGRSPPPGLLAEERATLYPVPFVTNYSLKHVY